VAAEPHRDERQIALEQIGACGSEIVKESGEELAQHIGPAAEKPVRMTPLRDSTALSGIER
jgi:hypothetical protein